MGLNIDTVPESVAIILDGNGRYAKKNNITRYMGHKAGCDNLETILEETVRLNIKYLTVYAFSTENWKRSEEEINGLFKLFDLYLNRIRKKAIENEVSVKFIGDIEKFKKNIYESCIQLEEETKKFDKCIFSIAFNYGGRDEIVRAINRIIKDGNSTSIDENTFSKMLDTKDIKDPDLLIRTSGELRLSNFLIWQSAYTELYFTDVLWPEFTIDEYHKAIDDYNKRSRRFGGR